MSAQTDILRTAELHKHLHGMERVLAVVKNDIAMHRYMVGQMQGRLTIMANAGRDYSYSMDNSDVVTMSHKLAKLSDGIAVRILDVACMLSEAGIDIEY